MEEKADGAKKVQRTSTPEQKFDTTIHVSAIIMRAKHRDDILSILGEFPLA